MEPTAGTNYNYSLVHQSPGVPLTSTGVVYQMEGDKNKDPYL